VNGRSRTCQIVNFVYFGKIGVGYIMTHQLKVMVVHQMTDIQFGTGKIIVETDNIVSL
jgi:hypothetical protein